MVTAAIPKGQTRSNSSKKTLPADIDTWLDRNQAADLIGCSVSTLLNLEARDKLHPARVLRAYTRSGDGATSERLVYVYDPKELMKVSSRDRAVQLRTPGELAARCFELLDEGKTQREIVIELREQPDTIRELRDKWLDAGGADRVLSPAAWERLEVTVGRFRTVAELVENVERIVNEPKNSNATD